MERPRHTREDARFGAHGGPLGRLVPLLVIFFVASLLLGARPSRAAGGDVVNVRVSAGAIALERSLAAAGGELVGEYGSFAIWRIPSSAAARWAEDPALSLTGAGDTIYLRGAAVDTRRPAEDVPGAGEQLWLVQFAGPIRDEWLDALRSAGLHPVIYMPENAYVVRGEREAVSALGDLAGVQWHGAYRPEYRLSPKLLPEIAAGDLIDVTIQLVTGPSTEDSLSTLLGMATEIRKSVSRTLGLTNVSLRLPAAELTSIARWPDVFNLERWTPPVKLDEVQGQILAGNLTTSGSNVVPASPGYLSWLASNGFPTTPASYPLVDVVDDGIDQGNATNVLHPDFHELGLIGNADRVAYIGNCTTDSTGNGVAGHGNLNAGIVGSYNDLTGSPHQDAGAYRIGLGMSPYGRIAGTKIFKNSGSYSISNCGNTDEGVVLASYNAGATFTSNSWGAPVGGDYDSSSQSYDALTRDAASSVVGNQEMLHVFAAGNDGPGTSTVGSPGTAKNVLTVGATENVRDQGVSDGCAISAANNADDMATFSSRGPTADSRVKPDIVAPGTHVQGPASQDPGYDGSGVCGASSNKYYPVTGQTLYTWSSGTSHSTPAVAGAASLVYNFYGRVLKPGATPSPAMLKALLIGTARYIGGTGAGGNLPSSSQGYGDVELGRLFDSSPMVLQDQATVLGATGATHTVTGSVSDTAKPFRVVLAWTDAPGSTTGNAYVNDLDLEVTVGGNVYRGNVFSGGTSVTGGAFDPRNNVEGVFLPAGTNGPFSVKVIAANIAGDGLPGNADVTDQDFALVIDNGQTCAPVSAPGSVGASGTAPNEITVTWSSSGPGTTYEVLRGRDSCSTPRLVVATTTSTSWIDTNVSGGLAYAYSVRARQGDCVSPESGCVTASTTGSCQEHPEFAGAASAGNGAVALCTIDVGWNAATPLCAGPVTYNVYRGASPDFVPSPSNRIATGVSALGWSDYAALQPGVPAYYIVRAVDESNGTEDQNSVVRSATPTGPIASTTWTDDAGDTGSPALAASVPWTVDTTGGHNGAKTYKSIATNNACAALTTPPLRLGAGSQLTFWSKWFLDASGGDKGQVEISADGGSTWTRVAMAYPATSNKAGDACSLPVGQKYFTGINNSWTQQLASLSAYAGMTVRLRFRISTDASTTGETWWIDDLSVTNVQTPGACTVGVVGLEAAGLVVDGASWAPGTSNGNGMLEPGEQVKVAPTWRNTTPAAVATSGTASALTGPGGASYTLLDAAASYGTIAAGGYGTATADPYAIGAEDPLTRPALHWDLSFVETLATGGTKTWTVHVGRSFTDVPVSHWAYRYVETILHREITSGCGPSTYCPTRELNRAEMAVLLLVAEHGPAWGPPPATGGVFGDVPSGHWAGAWIEALAAEGITTGCGGGNYCPDNPITRAEMAVFLLVAEHGPTWAPSPATGTVFTDVPSGHWAGAWIEALAAEGITGGCGAGKYCPDGVVSRAEMAVFLTSTFGLTLD